MLIGKDLGIHQTPNPSPPQAAMCLLRGLSLWITQSLLLLLPPPQMDVGVLQGGLRHHPWDMLMQTYLGIAPLTLTHSLNSNHLNPFNYDSETLSNQPQSSGLRPQRERPFRSLRWIHHGQTMQGPIQGSCSLE